MKTAQELFDDAFSAHHRRDPRSQEYKRGVLDVLRRNTGKTTGLPARYKPGTVSWDAWNAGISEGRQIWRNRNEKSIKKNATNKL